MYIFIIKLKVICLIDNYSACGMNKDTSTLHLFSSGEDCSRVQNTCHRQESLVSGANACVCVVGGCSGLASGETVSCLQTPQTRTPVNQSINQSTTQRQCWPCSWLAKWPEVPPEGKAHEKPRVEKGLTMKWSFIWALPSPGVSNSCWNSGNW